MSVRVPAPLLSAALLSAASVSAVQSPALPVGVASPPPPSLRLARRLSRMAFGAGLLLAPLWALGWAVARDVNATDGIRLPPLADNAAFVAVVLAWLMAVVGAAVFHRIGRSGVVRAAFGDDAFSTLSYVLPAVALSILGPISLQAVVGVPFVLAGQNFDGWMAFAIAGTVHVHVAFAAAMGIAAWRIAHGVTVSRVVLWPAVVLSLFPGAIIVFPPFLVWGCGALISRGFLKQARGWADADIVD